VRYNHKHNAVFMYNSGHSGQILIQFEYCGRFQRLLKYQNSLKFMQLEQICYI